MKHYIVEVLNCLGPDEYESDGFAEAASMEIAENIAAQIERENPDRVTEIHEVDD